MNSKKSHLNQHRFSVVMGVATMMFALCGSVGAAQLYQWKDDKGVMQYTDKPPAGKPAIKMKVKGPAILGESNAEPEDASKSDGSASATQASKEADAKQCAEARARLQILLNSPAVKIRNDDGTTRDLNKEDIKMEAEVSKLTVARYCK